MSFYPGFSKLFLCNKFWFQLAQVYFTCTISCNSSSLKLTPILRMLQMKPKLVLHNILELTWTRQTWFRRLRQIRSHPEEDQSWERGLTWRRKNLIEYMTTLSKTLKTCFRSSWVSFSASLLIISSTNSWKWTNINYFCTDLQEVIAWCANVTGWANMISLPRK